MKECDGKHAKKAMERAINLWKIPKENISFSGIFLKNEGDIDLRCSYNLKRASAND
ncbi:hypothetical protein GCM10027342_31520 [Photobacterium alginatilyticum]